MKRPQRVAGSRRVGVALGAKVPRTECAGYQRKRKQISGSLTPETGRSAIALALTWEGARWPVRTLPPKARAFLNAKSPGGAIPSVRKMAALFTEDLVREIRICWVPRLKGGDEVLSEPFPAPAEMRLGFQSVKTIRFGDILGVIYRRELPPRASN